MKISVRLFAICRERAGTPQVEVELPEGQNSLEAFKTAICEQIPALAPLMGIVRIAVNQEFALPQDTLKESDEIALIPPVSGGTGVVLCGLRTAPLSLTEVEQAVAQPSAGAVVHFLGTVRDHTGDHQVESLEYEAYPEMAEKFLHRVAAEVVERFPKTRVALLHRTGLLKVGEAAVAIAVSSPHRAEAFDGCRQIIERLKEDVPIWKKEKRGDGSIWVGTGS